MPFLPEDFDRKFFNAAHPGLISHEFFKGGELIEVINASPKDRIKFNIPPIRPEAIVMMKDGTRHQLDMNLDTVIVNTDEDLLFLVWRCSMGIYRKTNDILWAKTQLKKEMLS